MGDEAEGHNCCGPSLQVANIGMFVIDSIRRSTQLRKSYIIHPTLSLKSCLRIRIIDYLVAIQVMPGYICRQPTYDAG